MVAHGDMLFLVFRQRHISVVLTTYSEVVVCSFGCVLARGDGFVATACVDYLPFC